MPWRAAPSGLGGDTLGIAWFQNASLEWEPVIKVVAIGVPTFVMAAALLFALGVLMTNGQEAQQIGGLSVLVSMLPLLAIVKIGNEPNGVLAVVLSMVPFFSMMTVALREVFVVVPLWQIILSVGIQILFAIAAIWFAGRVFRLGLLRHGKSFSLRGIVKGVETATSAGVRS